MSESGRGHAICVSLFTANRLTFQRDEACEADSVCGVSREESVVWRDAESGAIRVLLTKVVSRGVKRGGSTEVAMWFEVVDFWLACVVSFFALCF